jgi:peptidoglycan/xylan/chitin deacetylase (PgdA/CDA1 family)
MVGSGTLVASGCRYARALVAVLLAGLIAALGMTDVRATASSSTTPAQRAASAAPTKYVYLTFDDGPATRYTQRVLDVLDAFDVRATFFELGSEVSRYPYLTSRVHRHGHSVQNHTWSHPDLRDVSWTRFRHEVLATDRQIRARTGYTPHCLRPPYGAVNGLVYDRAARLDKLIRLWTVDPRDWSRPGVSTIVHRVLDNVVNGSVVIFHDGGGDRSQTVAALPTILRTLKARGFRFARLWCQ